MFRGINAIEFNRQFTSNEDCYRYLIEWKWAKGYSCSKCGCPHPIKGRTYYYRRCRQCLYDESVTANTIFHSMKMPILKAFHIVFRLTAKKKGMSTTELGSEVGVQQKTAWLFKRKIQVAMRQNNQDKLGGQIDVDETLLGFHTSRKQGGRSLGKRKALMMAAQILPDGRTGNIRIKDIEDFKADTLKFALSDMFKADAGIRSDDYCSYYTLQQQGINIKIERSQKGKAFEEIHRQIMSFKLWLVGIHHRWSKRHLYAYADEYVFRFNRRNARQGIFSSLIENMMQQIPHPYPVIKKICAYST